MVTQKQAKRKRDIKTKLMAAICMLLVSSIMMVSTTYAWFTLSTAPEVTGITTAVGANGNLEMALQPYDGDSSKITSNPGDTNQPWNIKNWTWGNLVDISDDSLYGLNKITLYPAALNATGDDTSGYTIGENPLSTPEYGSDGRLTALVSKTITGVFQNNAFNESASYGAETIANAKGVRAVGIASGMTERQLAYRAAMSSANTSASKAQTTASQSLNNNGAVLANVAIEHATANDGADSYDDADVQAMLNIVNSLLGYDTGEGDNVVHTTGALEHIEAALKQYIVANSIATATDDGYAVLQKSIEDATLADLASGKVNGAVLPGSTATYITTLNKTKEAATEAKTTLTGLSGGSYTWAQISPALNKLADTDAMKINGHELTFVMEKDESGQFANAGTVANAIMANGLILTMASGAGVYADIADFCGDYSAQITMTNVNIIGIKFEELKATMNTATTQNPVYLTAASDAVAKFGASEGGSASNPISDFYGYIIDLAFRTNAADSELLLQSEAVDRIYTDGTNPDTMGHGATMTFEPTTNDVNITALMQAIRVVFFDTDSREIIGYARLDSASTVSTANGGYTMELMMTDKDGNAKDDNVIMALDQNTIHELSVMVYLDGTLVGNDDVAATAASSMTGQMSLQFASTANLVPMDYSDLKNGDGSESDDPAPTPTALTSVTTSPGGTLSGTAYYQDGKIGFQLTDTYDENDTVMVSVNSGTAVKATAGTAAGVTGWVADVGDATVEANTPITITITVAE